MTPLTDPLPPHVTRRLRDAIAAETPLLDEGQLAAVHAACIAAGDAPAACTATIHIAIRHDAESRDGAWCAVVDRPTARDILTGAEIRTDHARLALLAASRALELLPAPALATVYASALPLRAAVERLAGRSRTARPDVLHRRLARAQSVHRVQWRHTDPDSGHPAADLAARHAREALEHPPRPFDEKAACSMR